MYGRQNPLDPSELCEVQMNEVERSPAKIIFMKMMEAVTDLMSLSPMSCLKEIISYQHIIKRSFTKSNVNKLEIRVLQGQERFYNECLEKPPPIIGIPGAMLTSAPFLEKRTGRIETTTDVRPEVSVGVNNLEKRNKFVLRKWSLALSKKKKLCLRGTKYDESGQTVLTEDHRTCPIVVRKITGVLETSDGASYMLAGPASWPAGESKYTPRL